MSVELVARIKAELEAKGQRWQTNEDAAQITWRVAWALRHEGAKLIGKRPDQNGATIHGVRCSHDAIGFPLVWIDCLASAGPPANENRPVWQVINTSDAPLIAPFDLDAGVVTDMPPRPTDPLPPEPSLPTQTEMAVALTLLATEVGKLRDDLRKLTDMGELDITAIVRALEAQQQLQAKGLTGTLFGMRITLTWIP